MSRSLKCRAPGGAVVLIFALSAPCLGQRNPPTVPTVLVTALMGGFSWMMDDKPTFTVDRPPEDWPRELLPASPLRTVGGMKLGMLSAAVFSMPRRVDGAASYIAALKQRGYTPVSRMPEPSGFVAAPEASPPLTFCKGTGAVTVMQVDSTASMRWISVTRYSGGMSQGCVGADPGSQRAAPLKLPLLRIPAGATVRNAQSGWGRDHVETTAHVDTALAVEALMAHYASELSAAGWIVAPTSLAGDGMAMRTISTRDAEGKPWRGMLLLVTAGARRELTLRLARGE